MSSSSRRDDNYERDNYNDTWQEYCEENGIEIEEGTENYPKGSDGNDRANFDPPQENH